MGTMSHDSLYLVETADWIFVHPATFHAGDKFVAINRVTDEIFVSNNAKIIPEDGRLRTISIYGIVGVIRLLAGPYLAFVKSRERVGTIAGDNVIWKMTKFDLIPFRRSLLHLTDNQQKYDATYLDMLRNVVDTPFFYYSNTYDLSHSFQSLDDNPPDFTKQTLVERGDDRFIWNRAMLHCLQQFNLDKKRDIDEFCVPIIHGFVSINETGMNMKLFKFILISRRSARRAGTRLFYRGIDEDENVSNFVETEQIVEFNGEIASFVQIGGSIPLFWRQKPNLKYKPKAPRCNTASTQRNNENPMKKPYLIKYNTVKMEKWNSPHVVQNAMAFNNMLSSFLDKIPMLYTFYICISVKFEKNETLSSPSQLPQFLHRKVAKGQKYTIYIGSATGDQRYCRHMTKYLADGTLGSLLKLHLDGQRVFSVYKETFSGTSHDFVKQQATFKEAAALFVALFRQHCLTNNPLQQQPYILANKLSMNVQLKQIRQLQEEWDSVQHGNPHQDNQPLHERRWDHRLVCVACDPEEFPLIVFPEDDIGLVKKSCPGCLCWFKPGYCISHFIIDPNYIMEITDWPSRPTSLQGLQGLGGGGDGIPQWTKESSRVMFQEGVGQAGEIQVETETRSLETEESSQEEEQRVSLVEALTNILGVNSVFQEGEEEETACKKDDDDAYSLCCESTETMASLYSTFEEEFSSDNTVQEPLDEVEEAIISVSNNEESASVTTRQQQGEPRTEQEFISMVLVHVASDESLDSESLSTIPPTTIKPPPLDYKELPSSEQEPLDEVENDDDGEDDDPNFNADQCDGGFPRADSLKRHVDSNNKDSKEYRCSDCDKTFTRKGNLKLHERIHTGEKPFDCSECGKCFRLQWTLKMHKRSHTGKKPFNCNECGKSFRDPSTLARHLVTHKTDRPLCCSICGLTFKRADYLKSHEGTHKEDVARPFVCSFPNCGKAFRLKPYLKSHELIHSQSKDQQCEICGKAFNRKDSLRRHVNKVHGKET